jgi:hypothetical protein
VRRHLQEPTLQDHEVGVVDDRPLRVRQTIVCNFVEARQRHHAPLAQAVEHLASQCDIVRTRHAARRAQRMHAAPEFLAGLVAEVEIVDRQRDHALSIARGALRHLRGQRRFSRALQAGDAVAAAAVAARIVEDAVDEGFGIAGGRVRLLGHRATMWPTWPGGSGR